MSLSQSEISEIIRRVKQELSGSGSPILWRKVRDARGRYIIDIGGEEKTINKISNIIQVSDGDPEPFTAAFDKENCRILPDGTLQLKMTAPNSSGYARFGVRKSNGKAADGQSGAFTAREITTGVPYATAWQANTTYSVGDITIPTTRNGLYYIVESISGSGLSGSTEPSWPTEPGSFTDNEVTWNLYDVKAQYDLDAGHRAGWAAAGSGMKIVSIGSDNAYMDWDFGWGSWLTRTGQQNCWGRALLFSAAVNGNRWKSFRHFGTYNNSWGTQAQIAQVEYTYDSDATFHYACIKRVLFKTPFARLPHGAHYTLFTGSSWTKFCPFDVESHEWHNGELWTWLKRSPSAPTDIKEDGGFTHRVWSYQDISTAINDEGDQIGVYTANAKIYSQNFYCEVEEVVPVQVESGVGAIVRFKTNANDGGISNVAYRYFLYTWASPTSLAVITPLQVGTWSDAWYPTTDWQYVTSIHVRRVAYGGGPAACVEIYEEDPGAGTYTRSFYVSQSGSKFEQVFSATDTISIAEYAVGLGVLYKYVDFPPWKEPHLCFVYGEASGTSFTVYSMRTSAVLYTGTLTDNLADGANNYNLLVGSMKPEDGDWMKSTLDLQVVNIIVGGTGYLHYHLQPYVLSAAPSALDFSSEFTGAGYGPYDGIASGIKCPSAEIVNGEIMLTYSYSSVDYMLRTTIHPYLDSSRTYDSTRIEIDLPLSLADGGDMGGNPLAPIYGRHGEWVAMPTFPDESSHNRMFEFAYSGLYSLELGLIDGTVFHYYDSGPTVGVEYILIGYDTQLKQKSLDSITYDELSEISATSDMATGMDTRPDATDGNLAEFRGGQVEDADISADAVSSHLSDTNNPHGVTADQIDGLYLVPDVIAVDIPIPTGYQFNVHDALEISSGVTVDISGTLIVED